MWEGWTEGLKEGRYFRKSPKEAIAKVHKKGHENFREVGMEVRINS